MKTIAQRARELLDAPELTSGELAHVAQLPAEGLVDAEFVAHLIADTVRNTSPGNTPVVHTVRILDGFGAGDAVG